MECVGSFVADSSELDENGQGNPYGAYTFGLQWTRVRVDTWTWKIDVERIVSCFDVGRAINPMLLEGQLQGGIVMALGYSLIEEVVLNQGCITNPNFDRYLLPTAADVPPITLMVLEPNDPGGPFGAKGIGEPSTVPGAASVANAVAAAVEVDLQEIPITPERLCALAVAEKRRAMEM